MRELPPAVTGRNAEMTQPKAMILPRLLLALMAMNSLAPAYGADTTETYSSAMQEVPPTSASVPSSPPDSPPVGVSAPQSPAASTSHNAHIEAQEQADALARHHAKSRLSIYFASDSAELSDVAWATIADNAKRLAEDPAAAVTLVGYIDDLSSRSYGIALAQRRIQVVTDAMRSMGVALRRIRTAAYYREDADTVPCTTEICRTSYRRVEFRFLESRERRPPSASASQSRQGPPRRSTH